MNIIIIILAIAFTIITIPAAIVACLYLSWSTTHVVVMTLLPIMLILLYTYFWVNIITYVRKRTLPSRITHGVFLIMLVLGFGIIGGFFGYDAYENRFARVDTEVDLYQYQPFQSQKLAKLEETSTLHIEEPLPKIDGATAFYPVYAAMTQAIYPEKEYDVYNSEVVCSTTPIAYQRLADKEVDLIFAFEPSKEQQEAVATVQEEMSMTAIGKESFVFFVNANNPVSSLTSQQIKDIYSGKITNWKEVGGYDEKIKAFQRPDGSGSQTALLKMMQGTAIMKPLEEDVVSGMGGIISQTANYRNQDNAIGYSFRFFADEMVNNKEIKYLKIDGKAPTTQNIRNNTYPFIYPFYAIRLTSNTNTKVDQMVDWLQSSQGKELIEKSGYIAY